MINMLKKLNELKSGETGVLASYGSGGDLELKRHLLGMGFVKGAEVEVETFSHCAQAVYALGFS